MHRLAVLACTLCFFAQNVELLTVVFVAFEQVWLGTGGSTSLLGSRLYRTRFHLFLRHRWQVGAGCTLALSSQSFDHLSCRRNFETPA